MPIHVESFFLDPGGEGTLQQRIKRLVVDGILAGRLRPGERMPSSRRLARHLGVSRITVTIAFADLVADDYLVARGRSGYFVSKTAPSGPIVDVEPAGGRPRLDWARMVPRRPPPRRGIERPRDWRGHPFPLFYGQADPSLFDHSSWRLCAVQALGQRDLDALMSDQYERDDPLLIEYILRHILPRGGIVARARNVLLTMGAQNALWLCASLLLNQRRTAAIEEPCYPGLRDILDQTRCRTVAIPVDDRGLPPDALPGDVDVIFATVSHHSPTNATMPLERRRRLLDIAAERGIAIVEDDYDFELAFLRAPSPALKSLDDGQCVIHVGSFSKSLFPGLRLGYLVAPEPFVREARALRSTMLRHPPGHLQRAAAYFLSLGHYDAQINRIRKAYARRHAAMSRAIRDHGLTVAGAPGSGGSCFWMRAPDGVDMERVARALHADGVIIDPGAAFFGAEAAPVEYYRLAYSLIRSANIPRGVELVARAIRAEARGTAS